LAVEGIHRKCGCGRCGDDEFGQTCAVARYADFRRVDFKEGEPRRHPHRRVSGCGKLARSPDGIAGLAIAVHGLNGTATELTALLDRRGQQVSASQHQHDDEPRMIGISA
jgi:hypothetical protein